MVCLNWLVPVETPGEARIKKVATFQNWMPAARAGTVHGTSSHGSCSMICSQPHSDAPTQNEVIQHFDRAIARRVLRRGRNLNRDNTALIRGVVAPKSLAEGFPVQGGQGSEFVGESF